MAHSSVSRPFCGLLTISLALAVLAGCIQPRKNMLPDRAYSYHQAYKWKEYTRAAIYVADPEDFIERTRSISEDYEVVEFEIVSTIINPEAMEAEVAVVRTYIVYPSVVVKQQRIIQQWKYDSKKKNWFLISPY